MPGKKIPVCDNEVVAVIVPSPRGILMFEREQEPPGVAPPCGHRDSHGTWPQTAVGETREETGLIPLGIRLRHCEWIPNKCRRPPGPSGVVGHNWTVYTAAVVAGQPRPAPGESRNLRWVDDDELAHLARRTIDYATGRVTEQDWRARPGLEPVWLWLLSSPGVNSPSDILIKAAPAERYAALYLACGNPPPVHIADGGRIRAGHARDIRDTRLPVL